MSMYEKNYLSTVQYIAYAVHHNSLSCVGNCVHHNSLSCVGNSARLSVVFCTVLKQI